MVYNPNQPTFLSLPPTFRVKFDFDPQTKNGLVSFRLLIHGREYGPYATTIVLTEWVKSNGIVSDIPSFDLETTLELQKRLIAGWFSFPPDSALLTGEMVLQASGLNEIETKEGLVYAL